MNFSNSAVNDFDAKKSVRQICPSQAELGVSLFAVWKASPWFLSNSWGIAAYRMSKLSIISKKSYLLFGFLKHKIFGLSEGNANKSTAMVTPTQASVTYLYVLNKHLLTTYKGHTFKENKYFCRYRQQKLQHLPVLESSRPSRHKLGFSCQPENS